MTAPLPPAVQQFATALRDVFGANVRLLFWADAAGNTRGNPAWDDPGAAFRTQQAAVNDRLWLEGA